MPCRVGFKTLIRAIFSVNSALRKHWACVAVYQSCRCSERRGSGKGGGSNSFKETAANVNHQDYLNCDRQSKGLLCVCVCAHTLMLKHCWNTPHCNNKQNYTINCIIWRIVLSGRGRCCRPSCTCAHSGAHNTEYIWILMHTHLPARTRTNPTLGASLGRGRVFVSAWHHDYVAHILSPGLVRNAGLWNRERQITYNVE